MSERYLTILEVSQKQAYIFSSNKLRDNIVNSAVIAWIMSAEYFEETVKDKSVFSKENNLVYSGGGHTVLEFSTEKTAKEFTQMITRTIRNDYPGVEVFATTMKYDSNMDAGQNLKELTKVLENKKAIRKAAFHQGSFGIEKIDTNTLKPVLYYNEQDKVPNRILPKQEEMTDMQLSAEGYDRVFRFDELGGSKNESNFLAVVHIDGNAMGKRIEELYQKNKALPWQEYKLKLRQFSEEIDRNFKDAYKDMVVRVADNIRNGNLDELDIQDKKFPVRRIITAGDDICFVTEGRIGIECAVAFLQALNQKKNAIDGEYYSACAGVAIVHQKYPFYKAYELAELLCSNAKKFGAGLSEDGTGKEISAIDWHIEYGEVKDTLEEIRSGYSTRDGHRLEMRPYIVAASEQILSREPLRQYSKFKKAMQDWNKEEAYARSKVKELRQVLKQGKIETEYYIKFNKLKNFQNIFVVTEDGIERTMLFDEIEVIDTFIELD